MNRRLSFPRSANSLAALLASAIISGAGVGRAVEFPPWWSSRGVLKIGSPAPDDFAALNNGQLKALATAAYDEMQANVPGGAGAGIDIMVKGWFQTNTAGAFVLDAQMRRMPKTGFPVDDFAAANIGTLLAVSKPFHARLLELYFVTEFPWTRPIADAFAVANIGQAKALFAWDLMRDSDHDGVRDLEDADDDNDGASDALELAHGFNPLSIQDGRRDSDLDGVSDLDEKIRGTNPLDYFNGNAPSVAVAGGSNLVSPPNRKLPELVTITVRDAQGKLMPLAPVSISSGLGGGRIAFGDYTDFRGVKQSYTNANGTISFQLEAPAHAGLQNFSVKAGAAEALITVMVNYDTPPSPVTNVALTSTHGRTHISWSAPPNSAVSFEVERSVDGKQWEVAATLPSNERSCDDDFQTVEGTPVFYRVTTIYAAP